MKIQLFEYGTLFIIKDKHYRLEIAASKVLAERVEDLKDLKEESPYFFNLKEITKERDRFVLDYEIESEYQPLLTSKKYSQVFRLALLNELLELDPLNTFKEKALIHPRNIFFKDLKTLKILYRSNQWLPYEDHLEALDQYKILILSMFSRFTYEKYRREKENLLKKEKDDFFFYVENAESVNDLKELIAQKLYQEETQHFIDLENEKQKVKRQKWIWAGICIGICAIAFGISLILQQAVTNKVQTAYAKELEKTQQESKFYKLLSEDKFDEAIKHLKETNGSDEEMANLYFAKGEYQKAIDIDKNLIKPTIEELYKADKKDVILELKADISYLDIEKKIISYDYSFLLSEHAFTEDESQLLRIGRAFVENGDLTDAKDVNNRLKNKELEFTIKKKELENNIGGLEQQIKEINGEKEIKPDDKKKQIDFKNKELTELKKELETVNKELG
ncbi:MAG: type VII secretion protein EssB/YukC [Bacillota bacterium]